MMWDVVWCAVPEMWFDVKIVEQWWWDVECITHRTTSHHSTTFYIAPFHINHHLWLYSKPHHIPRQTIIPHHITHFISHQHLSQHTIPFCNTIFQITVSATLYASHHISHWTPFHITYHIMPHSMYSTAHFRSHHILATLCIAPPHLTSHHIFHNPIPVWETRTIRDPFCAEKDIGKGLYWF